MSSVGIELAPYRHEMSEEDMGNQRKKQCLLIEDDVDQAAVYERWLHSEFDVVVATSQDEAVSVLSALQPDLIVSDICLDKGDAFALLESLRDDGRMPITVLTTAKADVDRARSAIQLGAVDFLPKPFSETSLVACAVQALQSQRPTAGVVARRKRILAIGAHPDDVEIGVGGTLLRHVAAGDEVHIACVSLGARGGDSGERMIEAELAATRLGATLSVGKGEDTKVELPSTIEFLEELIQRIRPDVVYTHSINDRHQDHRTVHNATRVAARGVGERFAYQSPSSDIAFAPSLFRNVDAYMKGKLDLVKCFRSQAKHAYMHHESILAQQRYWARFSNSRFVEPLEVLCVQDALGVTGVA